MLRKCTKCGIEKPLERFVKQKGKYRPDPYRRDCKDCKNSARRKNTVSNTRFEKGMIPWNKGTKGICKSWNKGKKSNPESVLKMRLSLAKNGKGRWSLNCRTWRENVLKRDNYECQKCFSKEKLHCHHIVPWKEREDLRFDVSNGIVYCQSCHAKLEGFQKGHIISENLKEKLRQTMQGKIPWNKKR